MSRIYKVLLIISILLFNLLALINPGVTRAIENCSSKNIIVTLDAPDNNLKDQTTLQIGTGRPFAVNIKIPDSDAQNNWRYYVDIMLEPITSVGTSAVAASAYNTPRPGDNPTSTETIGGILYRVYQWEFPNGLSGQGLRGEINEFRVELRHAEPGPLNLATPGDHVCFGPEKQIKTFINRLAEVGSCPLTMSNNYQSGTPVTGSVDLKAIPGVSYHYRLDNGDITAALPRNSLSPVPWAQVPGYSTTSGFDLTRGGFTDRLSPGTGISLPTKTGLLNGTYTATIYAEADRAAGAGGLVFACGSRVVRVSNEKTTDPTTGGGTLVTPGGGGGTPVVKCSPGDLKCTLAGGKSLKGCTDDPNNPGIATAIGCIHTNPAVLVKDLLTFIIGISGGLAFLMMLLGAFQMLTSAGNPDTLNAGKERLTNAIIGLLFVIFAVLLLQIIGIGILNIPEFKP